MFGDRAGGKGVGLLERSFIQGSSEHGILDTPILHGDSSDLHSSAHAVFLSHFHAENPCSGDLSIGHHRLLGIQSGSTASLISTGALCSPVILLLI